MAAINIRELFGRAFGVAPRYAVPSGDLVAAAPELAGIAVFPEDAPAGLSPLGTPILEKITVRAGSYHTFKVVDGLPERVDIGYPEYTFPLWPMLDVSRNKTVVKTAVNGRNGTVKEYVFTDDHRIGIRGLLVGEGNSYPHGQKRELYALFEHNAALEVVSRTLNGLGVRAIVIESIDFGDLEGWNNVCAFTVSAVSDTGVLLTIKEASEK